MKNLLKLSPPAFSTFKKLKEYNENDMATHAIFSIFVTTDIQAESGRTAAEGLLSLK